MIFKKTQFKIDNKIQTFINRRYVYKMIKPIYKRLYYFKGRLSKMDLQILKSFSFKFSLLNSFKYKLSQINLRRGSNEICETFVECL